MRGEGPFAVIRLEPVRQVAGEVGNQAVGVFLEAPHICSIFSPILQHCRGKFLVQPLGLGKALVGVDVAHLDAFFKPVHGFCGEESPLSDRQAARTIPGQPQADVGIVQNVFFVQGISSNTHPLYPQIPISSSSFFFSAFSACNGFYF